MKKLFTPCLVILLAACSSSTTAPTVPTGTPAPTLATPEATASPADTMLPTESPTLHLQPTSTYEGGLVPVEHPKLPGWVFITDPTEWIVETVETSDDYQETLKFLRHVSLPDCQMQAPPAGGLGAPDQFYRKEIAGRSFVILDYDAFSFYETRSRSLGERQMFKLFSTNDPACLTALEALLIDMQEAPVFYGEVTLPPASTSTPRPPLGFACDSKEPLLRLNDTAFIIADALWLRSEPRRSEDTKAILLPKYAPYDITIDGGPVCDNDYIFWHITASPIGEGGGDVMTGWLAEANASEYFLENMYP